MLDIFELYASFRYDSAWMNMNLFLLHQRNVHETDS